MELRLEDAEWVMSSFNLKRFDYFSYFVCFGAIVCDNISIFSSLKIFAGLRSLFPSMINSFCYCGERRSRYLRFCLAGDYFFLWDSDVWFSSSSYWLWIPSSPSWYSTLSSISYFYSIFYNYYNSFAWGLSVSIFWRISYYCKDLSLTIPSNSWVFLVYSFWWVIPSYGLRPWMKGEEYYSLDRACALS